MMIITGKAREEFLEDLGFNIPLEKILEFMSDSELLMKQMLFFDKIPELNYQDILRKIINEYPQSIFGNLIKSLELANEIYNSDKHL